LPNPLSHKVNYQPNKDWVTCAIIYIYHSKIDRSQDTITNNMSQIKINELPENLQQLFTEVQRTKTPLTVIDEDKPVVIIYPATTQAKRATFGAMKGSGEILGDLISSPVSLNTWEVLQ
jgi:hypothetical protein